MPKLDEDAQRARRDNILNAAERCFSNQGFHSASMHDICREAGVSPGALYLYFKSKEDLIAAICERERTAFAAALTEFGDAPDFMAALKKLGDAYCLEQPPEKFRFQVEINAEALRNAEIGATVRESDKIICGHFAQVVEEARQKGRIDPKVEPELISQIICIIGDGLFLRRAIDPDLDVEQCMDVILSLLASLVRPVKDAEQDETASDRGEHASVH